MFRKPTIWDLLSISIGALGLGLTGAVAISVSPTGAQVLFIFVSTALMVALAVLRRFYRERSAFELRVEELSVRLIFTEGAALNGRIVPKARLIRTETLNPRKNATLKFRRFQKIYDPVDSQSELNDLPENYRISCDVLDKKIASIENTVTAYRRNLKFKKEFSEFRELYLVIDLPDVARNNRIKLREEMDLQSSYTEDEEFYNLDVADFAAVRKFRIEARSIVITDARYELRTGISDVTKMEKLKVIRDDDVCYFEFELRRVRPGARVSVRWHWLLE